MFSSVVGLRRSSKPLPKAKLAHTKKQVMAYVCWSAVSLIQYRFLNPSKTIILKYAQQINRMHWKLQWLQPALVNRMSSILLRDNARPYVTQAMLQKLNKFGYEVLPYPPYSPDLSPTGYQSFKHLNNFLQGKRLHNQQEAENAFQEFTKSQRTDFYATGISKPICCW